MNAIFKRGFPDGTPEADAVTTAVGWALESAAEESPDATWQVVGRPQVIRTAEHEAAGEFLVRVEVTSR